MSVLFTDIFLTSVAAIKLFQSQKMRSAIIEEKRKCRQLSGGAVATKNRNRRKTWTEREAQLSRMDRAALDVI